MGASGRGIEKSRTAGRGHRLLLAFILVAAASLPSIAEPLRIGTVTIRNGDVFSDEEAAHGVIYRSADQLHAVTRPDVIRKFLLFKEGDRYEPGRLAETERNLRTLRFLRAASVKAGPPHDGVVDVVVTTLDAWSIEPGTSAGMKGGVNTYGAGITDSNLAGSGRQVSVSYDHGIDRSRAAIDYADPAFLRPYWKARLTYAQNSDGFEHRLAYGQPFYSATTPYSTELAFEELRRDDSLYQHGIVTSTLQQNHRQFTVAYGIATDATERSATRWSAGVRFVEDRFRDGASPAPAENRNFRYAFLRFNTIENDFIERNFVDEDVRYQDFNLGRQISLEAAISPAAFGAGRTTESVRGAIGEGAAINGTSFATGNMEFESRLDHGLRNAILSGNSRYVHAFDSTVPQTFVARLMFNSGWNLDREVQFFADGATGLRGYHLHAFSGSRNLVMNIEQRLYFGRELLQLISPGVVLFADVGEAAGGPAATSGLKSDAGAGLRIGLPRAPRNVLRIDLGYPLQRDPLGRRRLLVSFSSGQAF